MAELAELWYVSSRLQAENETQGARWAPPGPAMPARWAHIPVATEMTGECMLGLVLVADPPPGSALRLPGNASWQSPQCHQRACSTAAGVGWTTTGNPDPSVDGAGAGHGQLARAGYPVSWGSLCSLSTGAHFDFVLVYSES